MAKKPLVILEDHPELALLGKEMDSILKDVRVFERDIKDQLKVHEKSINKRRAIAWSQIEDKLLAMGKIDQKGVTMSCQDGVVYLETESKEIGPEDLAKFLKKTLLGK